MTVDNTPSEFGGAPGLIQPEPHNPENKASEMAMLERQVDPWDDGDSVERVLAEHRAGTYDPSPVPAPEELLPLAPDVIMASIVPEVAGFRFVGVGNIDTRTVRIKAALHPTMEQAVYGPESAVTVGVAPIVDLRIGSLASGKWYLQILMNGLQVTQVWDVVVP